MSVLHRDGPKTCTDYFVHVRGVAGSNLQTSFYIYFKTLLYNIELLIRNDLNLVYV